MIKHKLTKQERRHRPLTIAKALNTVNHCPINGLDSSNNPTYRYSAILPLAGKGCDADAIQYYYQVGKSFTYVGQAQYLYNAAQSTSQVNADLMTATFMPGFQVVLAGTGTAGSSQPSSSPANPSVSKPLLSRVSTGSAQTTTTSTTDSVATTVSKLEQGGDFNLRFPYPLVFTTNSVYSITLTPVPNVGFMINGISGQNTITNVTNYSFNFPLDLYGELESMNIANQVPAVIYGDVKYGGEAISQQLSQAIGTARVFGIGVASFGIQFANSVRVGGQYYFGPKQAYCLPTTTGGCTSEGSNINGFHFVVSFTPTTGKPS
jgi:hypothetical protein